MLRFKEFLNEEQINPNQVDLKKLYQEYNKSLFGNDLPEIPVYFKKQLKSKARSGFAHVKVSTKDGDVYTVYDLKHRTPFAIKPDSLYIELEPRLYEDQKLRSLLIHEMIHIFMYTQMDNIWNAHDGDFERKREALSKQVGFEIMKNDVVEASEFTQDELKEALVVIIDKKDGTHSGMLYKPNNSQILQDAEKYADYYVNDAKVSFIAGVRIGKIKSYLANVETLGRKFKWAPYKLELKIYDEIMKSFKLIKEIKAS